MSSTRTRPLFYGRYIAAMAFTAHFMARGSSFYIFNAFMEPLIAENGWTYTQINRSLILGPAIGIASQLFYGTMIYRIGPRRIMAAGHLLSGLFFILLGRVELFGRDSFAPVAKFMPLFFVLQGIGPEAMGQSMDRTGSYDHAYAMFVGLNRLAIFLVLSIRRPRNGASGPTAAKRNRDATVA